MSSPVQSPSLSFTVSENEAGERLDLVVARHAGITRSRAKALMDAGLVTLPGETGSTPKAGLPVRAGLVVEVRFPEPEALKLEARDVGLRILFEDPHLAVLAKPAGISVHPSHTERGDTVVHGLLHSLGSLSNVGGVERPGIVHRIDKGTSGVLVVSKTDQAHLALARQFKAHSIDRRYHALVYGDLALRLGQTGRIETFFGRHPTHRKKMTGKLEQGRKAITDWRVLESFRLGPDTRGTPRPALTLVECRLQTGRTHQIRVHLTEKGFPVVGDPLYGDHERAARALSKVAPKLAELLLSINHQLLHASVLGFEHPIDGVHKTFEEPLPADFREALELARLGRTS